MQLSAALQRQKPLLMGILNITPDSFHDGSAYLAPEDALAQLWRLNDAGADIIDIGGASSRPGHLTVSPEQELARIRPLLAAIKGSPLLLSVDTEHLSVAAAAVDMGAAIINYSGGRLDDQIFALAARQQTPLVVMHRQGQEGCHSDICAEIEGFFAACIRLAAAQGLAAQQLIFDPGLGFNKSTAENMAIMQHLPRLRAQYQPLLLGFSHKRFAAALSGESPGSSPLANGALTVFSLLRQVDILRVHDVAETAATLRTARALFNEEN